MHQNEMSRSSRTSRGSISLSFKLRQRVMAWFSIVLRYSGRVVSEKPRWVRPVALDKTRLFPLA
jgi:hypothetical protein